MLKETYFSALKKIQAENTDAHFIAVSRVVPKGCIIDRWLALAPSYSLLKDYQNFKVNWEQYTEIFKEEMKYPVSQKQMRDIKMLAEKEDVYLVCWEGNGKNCHRHILIDLINKM